MTMLPVTARRPEQNAAIKMSAKLVSGRPHAGGGPAGSTDSPA